MNVKTMRALIGASVTGAVALTAGTAMAFSTGSRPTVVTQTSGSAVTLPELMATTTGATTTGATTTGATTTGATTTSAPTTEAAPTSAAPEAPAEPTTQTFAVRTAGTVTVSSDGAVLSITGTTTTAGFTVQVTKDNADEVKVVFTSAAAVVTFKAELEDGEIAADITSRAITVTTDPAKPTSTTVKTRTGNDDGDDGKCDLDELKDRSGRSGGRDHDGDDDDDNRGVGSDSGRKGNNGAIVINNGSKSTSTSTSIKSTVSTTGSSNSAKGSRKDG